MVAQAGGIPLLLPTDAAAAAPPAQMVDAIDALLVSGGGSIPGQYFRDNPDPTLRDTNPVRYDLEVELIRAASERGLPLLGICRGHQTICEALVGSPVRNLGVMPGVRDQYQELQPATSTHSVSFETVSRVASCVGESGPVNRFHGQVIVAPSTGCRVTAYSDVVFIAAMEAESGFGIGVQYQPEWLS